MMRFPIFPKAVLAVSLATISAGALIGCGSGDTGKPESIATQQDVNNMVEMRKYFDKASGNWSALSPEDQAAFTKLAGDDAKAKKAWDLMVTPFGSNPSQAPK